MSGNSKQRSKAKAAQERLKTEVKAQLLQELQHPLPSVSTQPEQAAPTIRRKVWLLWESPITWGGIGVLVGAIASLVSLKIQFIVTGIVLAIAIWRTNFFEGKRDYARAIGNGLLCLAMSFALMLLWRVIPKPKEPPTLDQMVDAFGEKFPSLSGQPATTPPVINVLPPKQAATLQLAPFNEQPVYVPEILKLGAPLAVNVKVTNYGPAAAEVFGGRGRLYLFDHVPDKKTEEKATEEFKKWSKKRPRKTVAVTIAATNALWFTAYGDDVTTQPILDGLHDGHKSLYLVAEEEYSDPLGRHTAPVCAWMQAWAPPMPMIWHFCGSFNKPF